MKQAKKIFRRMCLNNWGGIDHKVLEFNEYVNLFSGKSGSGKSTVMDALQVVLYGSFSPSFLNKAADDTRNRRSVLSYLKGAQKDGSSNREGEDFCSQIVLEIEDTGLHSFTCIGVSFEVHKNDADIKKHIFFSHSGKIPKDEYYNSVTGAYTCQQIKQHIGMMAKSDDNRGRVDVNRIYNSREAYQNAVYEYIFGYIDDKRFMTMEKSAIALKMTNGTSQFIKDYMFPRSEEETVEKISDQLGAYREIKEKIEDMEKRINLLTQVESAGVREVAARTDIERNSVKLSYVEVLDAKKNLELAKAKFDENSKLLADSKEELESLESARKQIDTELNQVKVDLQASDLGSREQHLKDLNEKAERLADDSRLWRAKLEGISKWGDDEFVSEYISNPLLNMIDELKEGKVTEELCINIRSRIEKEKANIDNEYQDYSVKKKEISDEIKEKQANLETMKKGEKPYRPDLKQARAELERRLGDMYGRPVHVYVIADLFDIRNDRWKNAIEGRLGRRKYSLVTEPQYSKDAAKAFRAMRNYDNVELLNTEDIIKEQPKARTNSLYEDVETDKEYVDVCLRYLLGHIIKCESVDELLEAKDGVMPDCYSYSSFSLRHLKRQDYQKYACIGRKVSKSKIAELESEISKLIPERDELIRITERLRRAAEFERLSEEPPRIVSLSKAAKELEKVYAEIEECRSVIVKLKSGKYKELEDKLTELTRKREKIDDEYKRCISDVEIYSSMSGRSGNALDAAEVGYHNCSAHYIPNEQIEAEVNAALAGKNGFGGIRRTLIDNIEKLRNQMEQLSDDLAKARAVFNREYPSCGFTGVERSNECYLKLLEDYRQNFEPQYQNDFEKQCELIYKSLRDNVIGTIHGNIKAAIRHKNEINRLLRKTNFSDSIYQIKIEAARNENGQFYDMLMAEELDSKNIDNDGIDGQISFGDDLFYQKYEKQIKLLTDKFMPGKNDEEEKQANLRKKQMEQYADYRNYLEFSMYEQVMDAEGNLIRENHVDDMAGLDSGGEGQNPKYVALLAGFAMLYMQQSSRDSKIKLVLLDEAFSKMDQERSAVCLKYARQMELQLIVCVPDERLQSLIRNVDCVYGFRRHNNHISMMHIDKGEYLKLVEGEET